MPCHITYTNDAVHELIRANLHRAPMYSGQIQSSGPRYCPSIEDKVVRFADKDRHQLFLEPEGRNTHEVYVNGVSTSLPRDVQDAIFKLIPGLENAQIMRYGYAVEYDFAPPEQLWPTLETKRVAGCISPGRSTARPATKRPAAQGLIAGANAALAVRGDEPLVLDRERSVHRRADRRSRDARRRRAVSHVHEPRRVSPAAAARQRRSPTDADRRSHRPGRRRTSRAIRREGRRDRRVRCKLLGVDEDRARNAGAASWCDPKSSGRDVVARCPELAAIVARSRPSKW